LFALSGIDSEWCPQDYLDMLKEDETMKESFYITVAIDYCNAEPHIGHAYEKVIADAIVRYCEVTTPST